MSRHRLKIVNDSGLPDTEIERLVRFVVDRPQVQPLSAGLAIRVRPGHGGGYAATRRRHAMPAWASGYRFCVSVAGLGWVVGTPHVCWHATGRGKISTDELHAMYEAGERRFGRWPIYLVNSQEEWLIHILAHEVRHIVQFDNGRSTSEVDCELFAEQILEEWRALTTS